MDLLAVSEAPVTLGGEGALPGKKQISPTAEAVRCRVAEFLKTDKAPCAAGVQPLNAGFFCLERMRSQSTAKAREDRQAKVRG